MQVNWKRRVARNAETNVFSLRLFSLMILLRFAWSSKGGGEGVLSENEFPVFWRRNELFHDAVQSDAKRCIDMACVTPFVPSFSSSPVVLNVNLRSLANDRRSWISMTRFKLFLILVRPSLVIEYSSLCFIFQSFVNNYARCLFVRHRVLLKLSLIKCYIIFRIHLNSVKQTFAIIMCYSNYYHIDLIYRSNCDNY